MNNSVEQAIEALRTISRNEEIKAFILKNKAVYKVLLRIAMRFIGGETLDECFKTSKKVNNAGHTFTIDFMGESTRDKKTANEATAEFLKVIDKIIETKSNASVSLDLSHIGLVIDKDLGHLNATKIVQKAQKNNIEIMISMEGLDRVDDILNEYYSLVKEFGNVGITLQAYLHRTEKDLQTVLAFPGKIRLVKGAYQVSRRHALPRGTETDMAYKKYMESILKANHPVSIASHDEKILLDAEKYIIKNNLTKANIEFEMLHGVTPALLNAIHKKGYRTREYLPYGKEWYLYVCHRLAENPLNIYQALADAAGIK